MTVTDTEALAIAAAIRHAVVRLAARLRVERPEDGLSTGKLGVLGHLYRRGESTPGSIAAAARQQPQSLTRLLGELEGAGLVRKRPVPGDRRQVMLEITQEGRLALGRNMAGRDSWLSSALGGLEEAERELLLRAAPLIERIAEADVPGAAEERGT